MVTIQDIRIDGSVVYRAAGSGVARLHTNNAGTAGHYEQRIAVVLATLQRYQCGRILLAEVSAAARRRGHQITIAPWTEANTAGGGMDLRPPAGNPPGQPMDRQAQEALGLRATTANLQVSDRAGVPRAHTGDNPFTAAVEQPGQPMLGTGEGTDAVVLFDPARITRAFVGGNADEILFHELIHAKHALEGRSHQSPTHDHYDNQEEFGAVLATDIYLSDKGALLIRNSHQLPAGPETVGMLGALGATRHTTVGGNPFAGMAGGGSVSPASAEFAHRHQAAIAVFFAQDQRLANRLAQEASRVPYNPLRDFLAANAWARRTV
jgi:hypothetical protein